MYTTIVILYLNFHLYLHTLFHFFFFFNDTATTEIYTLSLHDALPISFQRKLRLGGGISWLATPHLHENRINYSDGSLDRKSTRLNSSHGYISYAVFCLKKKKKMYTPH